MRRTLCVGMAAIGIVMSAPALAVDCEPALQQLNDRLASGDSNSQQKLAAAGNEVRDLRNAARIFQRNGQEAACLQVVAGIAAFLDSSLREQTAVRPTGQVLEKDLAVDRELDRIKKARPVTESVEQLRGVDIVGAELRNFENDELGDIEDVVLTPDGKIQYAIVGHGGFLGLGEKQIAIPWEKLSVTNGKEDLVFVLHARPESLERAPKFERGAWKDIDNPAWREANGKFYEKLNNMAPDTK